MEALQNMSELSYPPTWPMVVAPKHAPPAVEERADCLSCACTICNSPRTCKGPVWAGNPISPAPLADFKSMVRILSISAEMLSSVLKRCKLSNITLTGLLHALICTSLCRGVEVVPGVRAVTPFSVRKLTGASEREIVNHISFLSTYVPGTDLSKIAGSPLDSATEEQHIIQLAQLFSSDIATKVKQFPHGSMFTHLNGVKDLLSLYQSQAGTERLYTYELSNLGSARSVPTQPSDRLKLDKLVFTQCGMVSGPAIGFNCASIPGGSFTISITWERGVVEESLIEQVAQDLELRLNYEAHADS
ncbi:Alcohol acetyltransferase [Fusarium falciforme]